MQRLLQNNIDRPTPQPIIALLDPHPVCKREIEALRQNGHRVRLPPKPIAREGQIPGRMAAHVSLSFRQLAE